MTACFGIVDLFSGPGGLGEGFSAVRLPDGSPAFDIDLSIEFDETAHKTLRLRSFLRKIPGGFPDEYYSWLAGTIDEPDWPRLWPAEWAAACREVQHAELGTDAATRLLADRMPQIRRKRGDATVLIGGPPCQAYSLAGRGRKASKGFAPHPKDRHLLYREYIRVLRMLEPAAFVMENVKGLLSSKTSDAKIVDQVLEDLRSGGGTGGYRVFPIAPPDTADPLKPMPTDFVVHAEEHGVPQARHRVIIVGVRNDLASGRCPSDLPGLRKKCGVPIEAVLDGLPELRSRISGRSTVKDGSEAWGSTIRRSARRIRRYAGKTFGVDTRRRFDDALDEAERSANRPPASSSPRLSSQRPPAAGDLGEWLFDPRVIRPSQHDPRAHIPEDLERYLFMIAWGRAMGRSPKARDFPRFLAPNHRSWGKGFADRFRVQVEGAPSSTIVCHISKDGHYFIHPDPAQVRSLTVREVARLQTFPDNYHFVGSRTQAYVQVGNAVPPYLARQIGEALALFLATSAEGRAVTPRLIEAAE